MGPMRQHGVQTVSVKETSPKTPYYSVKVSRCKGGPVRFIVCRLVEIIGIAAIVFGLMALTGAMETDAPLRELLPAMGVGAGMIGAGGIACWIAEMCI